MEQPRNRKQRVPDRASNNQGQQQQSRADGIGRRFAAGTTKLTQPFINRLGVFNLKRNNLNELTITEMVKGYLNGSASDSPAVVVAPTGGTSKIPGPLLRVHSTGGDSKTLHGINSNSINLKLN